MKNTVVRPFTPSGSLSGSMPIALLLSLFILFYRPVIGQGTTFTPVKEDESLLTSLSGKYEQQYKEELEKLPAQNKKDLVEVYGDRWKNVKEKFDKQEIYTSSSAQDYLDALVAEIVRSNPALKNRVFRCYFSRSWIPNASYIGEGIILFNMGLFYRLDNESQAAFVLCHEIAHFLLQHPEKSIAKYVNTINSPEVQAELRKIKGAEYRKRERLQDLVKGLTFDSRRHSRDHESEADSLGVVLLGHTRFDPNGALTTLALLNVIDTDTLNTEPCLQVLFDSKDYPFRKKWIAREQGLLGGHARLKEDSVEADSVKTHPDCPLRIKLLTPLVKKSNPGGSYSFIIDPSKFGALQNEFRYEVIEYTYSSDEYCRSLFLTMEMLQRHAGDAYLVAQLGRLLNGIYTAQKGHRLSKVTDLPSPGYSSNYNTLLQFIQNLYLEDIASINYYYLSRYHPQMDGYALFKNAYTQSDQIINNKIK
jgi:Zn-dependent protease with chaperone function